MGLSAKWEAKLPNWEASLPTKGERNGRSRTALKNEMNSQNTHNPQPRP